MARSTLATLPPELLILVCSYLCSHCHCQPNCGSAGPLAQPRTEQAALLNLGRACRVLHAAAEPFLYHSFRTSQPPDLYFFVRTLQERTDLRSRVLEVDVSHRSGLPMTTHHRPPPPSPTPRLSAAVQHVALVSLLLQLAPNLESSHFRVPGHELVQILRQPDSLPSSTPSPKKLAFSSLEFEFFLDGASRILQLAPNLGILHCHGCTRVSELFPTILDRKMETLTELTLSNTRLTAASLRNLLSAAGPRLSKVSIRTPSSLDVAANEYPIEFDEVLAALQPWNQTLRGLSFVMDGGAMLPRPPHHLGGVHLLREFQGLKHLEVQAGCFDFYGDLGPREDALTATLPPPISELRLFGYSGLVLGLQGLVRAFVAGQFADLHTIEIDDQGYEKDEPESEPARALREVAASFRSAGVDYEVHPEPDGPDEVDEAGEAGEVDE